MIRTTSHKCFGTWVKNISDQATSNKCIFSFLQLWIAFHQQFRLYSSHYTCCIYERQLHLLSCDQATSNKCPFSFLQLSIVFHQQFRLYSSLYTCCIYERQLHLLSYDLIWCSRVDDPRTWVSFIKCKGFLRNYLFVLTY